MDDLSGINQALMSAAQAASADERTLDSLLEQYLTSSRPEMRESALQSFCQVINDKNPADLKSLLEEKALTYLPLVLPFTGVDDCELDAKRVVLNIGTYGRPREVVLALNEGLQSVEERCYGFVVSDNEDGEEFEDEEEDGVDWNGLSKELEVIMETYADVLTRLPNARSTPTLISLSDAVESVLPLVALHTTSSTSRSLLSACCKLIENAWQWTQTTEDKGGEQRAILSHLLFMSTALLAPRVQAALTTRWFIAKFPRFAGLHPEEEHLVQAQGGQTCLSAAVTTAGILQLTHSELLARLTHPSSTSPHSSLGSLFLLVSSLLSESTTDDSKNSLAPSHLQGTLLTDSMPVLSAALSSAGMDAAVTWTWHLIQAALEGAQITVEHETATLLLELLVPLTAVQPSPTTRLALFKLLGAIIQASKPGFEQILLFQQLLEPSNPFEQVRVRALSLLREHTRTATLDVKQSAFLCPDLLNHLYPILSNLSPKSSDSTSSLDMSLLEFTESFWLNWLTDTAGFLWVLHDLDKDSKTGVRSVEFAKKIQEGWMIPVQGILEKLREELVQLPEEQQTSQGAQFDFLLNRLGDALVRVGNTFSVGV